MKAKKKARFWFMTRILFSFIAAIILIWVAFHYIKTAYEQKSYPAPGKLVEVNEKNMHVYTKGEGENTIVLLSGLGTAAPVLDFEPLINELALTNKVVVVEPFGYGWSDLTTKERTVENIVEELRIALQKSNIEGPYILMPHSLSGIYSMYFADKYPSEVKAVIGIDPTLPQALEYFGESAPAIPNMFRFAAPSGLARLMVSLNSENFLPIAEKGIYTENNLKITEAISAWKGYNKNIVDEANEIQNNMDKAKHMTFPKNMPVLLFTKAEEQVNEEGKSYVTFYRTQLNDNSPSQIVTLKGHHYLHWTRYKEMSEQVNNFTNTF